MRKIANLLFILLLLIFQVSSQTWRSTLYPENWKPGFADSQGRFLHDFSYAGYQSGLTSLPVIKKNIVDITKSPYFADNTGATDVLAIIQLALNNVGKAGGGVVYLPQGTYKVNVSAAADNSITIAYSNVVLRGAGYDKTFIYNANSNIRNTSVISIKPLSGSDWTTTGADEQRITKDLLLPTDTIPIASVNSYKIGDWVIIRSNATDDFIAEHQMTKLWSTSLTGPVFYRYVVAIDVKNSSLIVDAPTRYYLKTRDNARVYKVRPGGLTEVGVENFSFGNNECTLTGFGNLDFDVAGTGAYEVHGSFMLSFFNSVNCWVKNIRTYHPTDNLTDNHVVSNVLQLVKSRFITVDSCVFKNTQYRGEGGNGYLFSLGGNDCMIKNCLAVRGRHNYDFKSMLCSGNVVLRCRGENTSLSSDFHMHLSMANLFDNFTGNKDVLEANFRPYGSFPYKHGHSTTQSVFWNTNGEEYKSGKSYIISSKQFGWGYIIGTRGIANAVVTLPMSGTQAGFVYDSAPEDFKEGIGNGDNLQPQSLYEDQLAKRKIVGRKF